MNKQEAIQAIKEGKKVTHIYFSPDEWVTLTPSGLYKFEDGVVCTSQFFWFDRKDVMWETDWTIWNEPII